MINLQKEDVKEREREANLVKWAIKAPTLQHHLRENKEGEWKKNLHLGERDRDTNEF